MTREELKLIKPGTKMLIKDHFVEDPHELLTEYLGTVQIMERFEFGGTVWVYFENLSQPFALSEIECVVFDVEDIDDGEYDVGDMSMIFGEVAS